MTVPEEKDNALSDRKENNMENGTTNGNFPLAEPQLPSAPNPGGQATVSGPLLYSATIPSNQASVSGPLRRVTLARKALKGLTVTQLILGLLILIFGSSCLGIGQHMLDTWYWRRGAGCWFGTGTWVGVLSIATGSLGVAAVFLRSFPRGAGRCLLISFFVLCIISAIANAILLAFSIIWSVGAGNFVRGYYSDSLTEGILALNILLVIFSFASLVLCIISSSFICYLWTCCSDDQTTAPAPPGPVSYVPPPPAQIYPTLSNQPYVLVPLSALQRPQDGTVIIG